MPSCSLMVSFHFRALTRIKGAFLKSTLAPYLMTACFLREPLSLGLKVKEKSNYTTTGRDPFLYCERDHISGVLTRIRAPSLSGERCISQKGDCGEGGDAGDIFNK